VAAVPLFERAAACFTQGRQSELAEDAAAAAKELRARLADDYRVHRVRLAHAVEIGDDKAALKEVRVLRSLTEGKGGGWVEWLAAIDRRLTMKFGRKA
jgi:hypothetical protein